MAGSFKTRCLGAAVACGHSSGIRSDMVRTKPSAGIDAGHPLDPLSETEVALASEILRTEKRLGPHTRFTHVQLEEPAKSDVLGWKPNCRAPAAGRRHPVRQQDRRDACRDGRPRIRRRVTAWLEYSTKDHPYGQPPITIEEVFKVGDIVKADADWRRAMKRRGLDDEDIELVQVDPFSAGYFDREVEKGRRLVSAVSYWRKDIKDNGYAHPDRRRGRARRSDREQDRPSRRRAGHHSDPEEIAQLRPRLDPADAQRRQAAGCRAEGRSELYGRWLEGRLAELVVPRRLDRARGSRAAPDLVSRSVRASGRSSIGPASPT